jgi:hypothetical protein
LAPIKAEREAREAKELAELKAQAGPELLSKLITPKE